MSPENLEDLIMLNLTPYFERLLAALPFNEKLRKSFDVYIGDPGILAFLRQRLLFQLF